MRLKVLTIMVESDTFSDITKEEFESRYPDQSWELACEEAEEAGSEESIMMRTHADIFTDGVPLVFDREVDDSPVTDLARRVYNHRLKLIFRKAFLALLHTELVYPPKVDKEDSIEVKTERIDDMRDVVYGVLDDYAAVSDVSVEHSILRNNPVNPVNQILGISRIMSGIFFTGMPKLPAIKN